MLNPSPNESHEVQNDLIQSLLKSIGNAIGKGLPPNYGFSLMIFTFEGPELFYTSNAKREDMVRMMKEFIEREKGE